MRELKEIKYPERLLNDMDDYVINGKLTIEELYILAKKGGFDKNVLFFKVKDPNASISDTIYTTEVTSFGRGWTKNTAIIELRYNKSEMVDTPTSGG